MGKRILNRSNVGKAIRYLQKNGIRHAYFAAKERIEEEKKSDYTYQEPDRAVLSAQREAWKQFSYRFSIVVPAYETKKEFLRDMIDSVRKQSYERWELIIADASAGNQVEEIVAEYQEKEQERRIHYLRLMENRGIAENTNVGIEAATGDYIGLLDHDDFLAPDALYEMAIAIEEAEKRGQRPSLLYSDEDKYENNTRSYKEPNKKYDFNLDLILSNNYICHFMMVEMNLMKKLKLRRKFDGAQDYDLVLRVIDYLLTATTVQSAKPLRTKDCQGDGVLPMAVCGAGGSMMGRLPKYEICHIPKVLYHWRCHEASTAENTMSKSYAYEAGKAALEDFCTRRGWKANVSHSLHLGFYRLEYLPDMFAMRPEVGIIGGKVLDRHNKIASGIYNEKGERLYQGIHKEYSGGSTHRAALAQDCMAVDIRCIRVRRELYDIFEKITGVTYREAGTQKLADVSSISCDEEGYRKLSMELGKAASGKGYLVVWNPELSVRSTSKAHASGRFAKKF